MVPSAVEGNADASRLELGTGGNDTVILTFPCLEHKKGQDKGPPQAGARHDMQRGNLSSRER